MASELPADMLAKDKRIDDLVAQAAKLVKDLDATVADMKAILVAAGRDVETQQQISAARANVDVNIRVEGKDER